MYLLLWPKIKVVCGKVETRLWKGKNGNRQLFQWSRLLCTAMHKGKTASEKAAEGFVTCGLYPSLALDPPRAAVGIWYLSFLHVLPQVFCYFTYFLFFKGLPKLYTFEDSKKLDPPLLRGMSGVELQIVSVSLRESREHSQKRLTK